MTIYLPRRGLADALLRLLGKKRGVVFPAQHPPFGPHVQMQLRWESFWTALFRPRGADWPAGVVDPDQLAPQASIGNDSSK